MFSDRKNMAYYSISCELRYGLLFRNFAFLGIKLALAHAKKQRYTISMIMLFYDHDIAIQ